MTEQTAQPTWWNDAWPARLPVTVGAAGYERVDKPCEVPIHFTRLKEQAGLPGPFDPDAVRVVEVDSSGSVIDDAVTWQFDQPRQDDPAVEADGVLVWLMKGTTPAGAARTFHVYFNGGESQTQPGARLQPLVSVTDNVEDEEQLCFKVESQNAVYFYQKPAAGFSSLLDREGNDWINYHPGGGSAGEYRGIPNVAPIGFHPGYDRSQSFLANQGPLKVTLYSETVDRLAACTWEIYPQYATFTLLRKGPDPYWLLYEGTPGGQFDPVNDYIVHADGRRRPATEAWDEVLPDPEWLYFGSGRTPRVLYFIHHETDDVIDSYWPMQGNMTVFGFGRTSKGGSTLGYHMQAVPAHFTIGFAEDGSYPAAAQVINAAYRPLDIRVSDLEIRP